MPISNMTVGIIQKFQAIWDTTIESLGDTCVLVSRTRAPSDALQQTFVVTEAKTDTQIIIDWDPSMRELKALGVFDEDVRPLIGKIKFSDEVKVSDIFEIDFPFPTQDETVTQRLEVTDVLIAQGAQCEKRALLSPILHDVG